MKTSFFARIGVAIIAAASLFVATAEAQQAYTSGRTSMRSGPDRGYPQVAWIGGGASVYVNGCVRGYHWCDVTAGLSRGWVNARHLSYAYQDRRVAIYGNGAAYGFPIVGFALGSYWDNHYRGQAWYGNRPYWNSWRPGQPHHHGYPRAEYQPPRQAYAPAPAYRPGYRQDYAPGYAPRAMAPEPHGYHAPRVAAPPQRSYPQRSEAPPARQYNGNGGGQNRSSGGSAVVR